MYREDCGYGYGSGMSTWGIVIFLLILFAVLGGNRGGLFGGWGNGCGNGYGWGCGEGQADRDVLKLETAMTSQNALNTAQLETGIRAILNNQDKNTAAILEGQKDLYIRDLERIATQQFITSQNEQTRSLITLSNAQNEAKSAAETCALNARLSRIEETMLKAPTFTPFGGMPLIGCSNVSSNCGCGCNGAFTV